MDDKRTMPDDYINADEDASVTDKGSDEAILLELRMPKDDNSSDEDNHCFMPLVLCNTEMHAIKTQNASVISKELSPYGTAPFSRVVLRSAG